MTGGSTSVGALMSDRRARGLGTHKLLYFGALASLVYVFNADGVVRLETNSSNATLLRDVVPWASALVGLLVVIATGRRRGRRPMFAVVALFVGIAVVELFNPDTISVYRGIKALRPHLEFVPLFFLGFAVLRRDDRLRGLAIVMALSGAANGVMGLIQSGLSPEQLASWGPGYSTLVNGAVINGTVHGAAFFVTGTGALGVRPPALGAAVGFGGAVGFLALPFAIALILAGRSRLDRGIGLVSFPLIVSAIVTSETRSAVIAACCVAVAFFVLRESRGSRDAIAPFLFVAVVFGGILVAGANLTRYSSISPTHLLSTFDQQRGGSISVIPTYVTHYLLGAGLGTAGPGTTANASVHTGTLSGENEFVYLIVELGVPGLLVLLSLFVTAIRKGIVVSRSRRDRQARPYLLAVTAALIGCGVASLSGAVSATPPVSPFLWLAFGIVSGWSVTLTRAATTTVAATSPPTPIAVAA